ncbi:hypothetical protein M1523_00090 [Patescibacteria group bacterium]|nr:hypothetical protein [Patescibacteria group bacterium]MCL5091783.1 hypothetical protein [Patescibacteria group bacterium]
MGRGKILLIVIIAGLMAALAAVMIGSSHTNQVVSPVGKTGGSSSSTRTVSYLTYQDPSGFRFDYPDSLRATAPATLADNLYGKVGLTSKQHAGRIEVIAQATTATDLDTWLAAQKIDPTKTPARQLKLADLTAEQFATSGATITVALDQGAVMIVKLEAKADPAYWITGYNKILTSFAFVRPDANQGNANNQTTVDNTGTSGAVEFEGEEVVQ